jgi:hypothetical protein
VTSVVVFKQVWAELGTCQDELVGQLLVLQVCFFEFLPQIEQVVMGKLSFRGRTSETVALRSAIRTDYFFENEVILLINLLLLR